MLFSKYVLLPIFRCRRLNWMQLWLESIWEFLCLVWSEIHVLDLLSLRPKTIFRSSTVLQFALLYSPQINQRFCFSVLISAVLHPRNSCSCIFQVFVLPSPEAFAYMPEWSKVWHSWDIRVLSQNTCVLLRK